MAAKTSKAKPDKALVKDQLQMLQAANASWGTACFAAAMLWILARQRQSFDDEQDFSVLVPFKFNRIQVDLFPKLGKNNLFVKPRQVGGTTFFSLIRLLLPAILDMGVGSLLISQNNEYAEKHFRIIQRAYRHMGALNPYGDDTENILAVSLKQNLLHTRSSNRRELIFDQLDSTVSIASAEVEEAGQGVTLHHIVASEYSRWPKNPAETLSNVRGALVPYGTVDKECTANGAVGDFYTDCMLALDEPEKSDAKIHYYSHFWDDMYKDDLTPVQAKELTLDLKADELRLIAKMHAELNQVAYA